MDRQCGLLEFRQHDLQPAGFQRLRGLIGQHPRQAAALLGILDRSIRTVGGQARRARYADLAAVLDKAPVQRIRHGAELNGVMRCDFVRPLRLAAALEIVP